MIKLDLTELKQELKFLIQSELKPLFNRLEKKEKTYLTIKEVSDYLKITPPTIYSLINNGTLSSYKIGKRTLLLKSEIDAALTKIESYGN